MVQSVSLSVLPLLSARRRPQRLVDLLTAQRARVDLRFCRHVSLSTMSTTYAPRVPLHLSDCHRPWRQVDMSTKLCVDRQIDLSTKLARLVPMSINGQIKKARSWPTLLAPLLLHIPAPGALSP